MDPTHLLPIGELSRRSGLTVSALRFYDREGVLRPAAVDPFTGYRRYRPDQVRDARMLAGMRRVQVPLAEMVEVLDHGDDAEAVRTLLEAHLARLEAGLRDARREVARLCAGLSTDGTLPVRVGARDLVEALRAVRYAVSPDPAFPALGGVLAEAADGSLSLVATDRYRLALARVPLHGPGGDGASPSGSLTTLLAASGLDRLEAWLDDRGGAEIEVCVAASSETPGAASSPPLVVSLPDSGASALTLPTLEDDFPDHRRLLESLPQGVAHELADLRRWAEQDEDDRRVTLDDRVMVDRGFLLEALDGVGAEGRATLPLDGQIGPLLLAAEDDRRLTLLMPMAPEPPPGGTAGRAQR